MNVYYHVFLFWHMLRNTSHALLLPNLYTAHLTGGDLLHCIHAFLCIELLSYFSLLILGQWRILTGSDQ